MSIRAGLSGERLQVRGAGPPVSTSRPAGQSSAQRPDLNSQRPEESDGISRA